MGSVGWGMATIGQNMVIVPAIKFIGIGAKNCYVQGVGVHLFKESRGGVDGSHCAW